MFGGHVHSPSKSLHLSTSPSQRGESRSHISPSGVSPSRLYLINEKEKCLGGMSTHLVRVFTTPLIRVDVENPDHSSAPAECRRQDYLRNEKENVWGACPLT